MLSSTFHKGNLHLPGYCWNLIRLLCFVNSGLCFSLKRTWLAGVLFLNILFMAILTYLLILFGPARTLEAGFMAIFHVICIASPQSVLSYSNLALALLPIESNFKLFCRINISSIPGIANEDFGLNDLFRCRQQCALLLLIKSIF